MTTSEEERTNIIENFPLDKLQKIFEDIINDYVSMEEKEKNNLNEDINVLLSGEANGGNINLGVNEKLIYQDIIRG